MTSSSSLGFVLCFAASVAAVPSAMSDALAPDVIETVFRLHVAAAAIDTAHLIGPLPGPTSRLVPLGSVLDRTSVAARLLHGSMRDAWNRPILYWSNGSDYVVGSLGSDGRPQFDYALDPPYSGAPQGWAGSDPAEDLLIVNGVMYRGPSSQVELVRRVLAEIRSIGTAVESYAVDNNIYPGPVVPLDPVTRVELDLTPFYIRVLPIRDPWGNPYRFWSTTRAYAIVSYGTDGQPDYPYAAWGEPEFSALSVGGTYLVGPDVVFVSGQFVQWPAVGINP